jgi:hypothetical protein
MSKLLIRNAKGEVTEVIESAMIRTAAEFDMLGGHEQILDMVREVTSSTETYFLPRGYMTNASVKWVFTATSEQLKKEDVKFMQRHRMLVSSYIKLRVAGHMPQVAYIVTFCALGQPSAATIDLAADGAAFLEGLDVIKTEISRVANTIPFERSARDIIGYVDDMLAKVHRPEDVRPLFELRGKLSLMIDRAAAKQKKGV